MANPEKIYITVKECFERTEKIQVTINKVVKSNIQLKQLIKGKLGVITILEKLDVKVDALQTGMNNLENNGHMSGTDKALIITGAIGGITGIATAIITAANMI